MSHASTIYVARHGERIDHIDRDWKKTAPSPHDPFLTERGVAQAHALGIRLKDAGLTHIFASPFYRTCETANEVSKVTGIPIFVEPGLGEFLNRDWFENRPQLKSITELKEKFSTIDPTYEPEVSCRFPETRDDVIVRATITARILSAKYGGATILLVGHGMTCEFMARGLANAPVRPYISYCSLQTNTLKDDKTGMYKVDDEVDISFMEGPIKPVVKTNWYN